MADEAKADAEGACIAIDVGDSAAKIAVFHGGRHIVIANEQGSRATPCVVSFTPQELLVGDAAARKVARNAKHTIKGWRWFVGAQYSDETASELRKHTLVKFQAADDGSVAFTTSVTGKEQVYTTTSVAALLFKRVRDIAEGFLGCTVSRAVATVPAGFSERQRAAMAEAMLAAGLRPLRLISDPMAAALGYGLDSPSDRTIKRVVVFDLGGSSLEVTVLLASCGLLHTLSHVMTKDIGGRHFDDAVMELCQREFKRRTSMRVEGARSLAKLRRAAEIAKRALTRQPSSHVEVDSLFEGIDFGYNVSRARFEYECGPLLKVVTRTLTEALAGVNGGGAAPADIHSVLLVGGASRIPCVQQQVRRFFGQVPVRSDVNPQEAQALGVADEMAQMLRDHGTMPSGSSEAPVTLLPSSLRVSTAGGAAAVLVPKGATLPVRTTVFASNATRGQTSMCLRFFHGETPNVTGCQPVAVLSLPGLKCGAPGSAKLKLSAVIAADASARFELSDVAGDAGSVSVSLVAPAQGADDETSQSGAIAALCAPPGVTPAQEAAFVLAASERLQLVQLRDRFATDLDTGAAYVASWNAAQEAVLRAAVSAASDFLEAHPLALGVSTPGAFSEEQTKLKNAFKAACVMASATTSSASAASNEESGGAQHGSGSDDAESSDEGEDDDDDEEDDGDDEDDDDEDGSSSEEESSDEEDVFVPPPGVFVPAAAVDDLD